MNECRINTPFSSSDFPPHRGIDEQCFVSRGVGDQGTQKAPGETEVVREVDQTPLPYSLDREWFTLAITVKPKNSNLGLLGLLKGQPAKKAFYYTFIVFPSGSSEIGSVTDEPDRTKNELRHAVTLTHPFALLDREVTIEELIAFEPKNAGFMKQLDARPEDAFFGADWYDSVSFCRWLGQQSGLPETDQSYSDPESLDKETYPREPNPGANWAPRDWPLELSRRGFRLPTESEWEFASRAGARTSYGYGSDVSLLGRFGWFQENSGKHVHPPRELRPSVRGVFDPHGNLYEWTHDWNSVFKAESLTDPLGSIRGSYRVYRGGSWFSEASDCRSGDRGTSDPTGRLSGLGFRLALSPSIESGVKGAKPVGVGTEGAPAEQRP